LVVGDASGKGVAAALMIASVQSSLRTAALFTGNDPTNLLKTPYLLFEGKCQQAMEFYKSCFGGDLTASGLSFHLFLFSAS
jgi:serine phosphatase RsbU (regulator of sigma subunit)